MIKMTNVYKEYPNGMKAIAGLTVNIKQGEFVYVVGPSGAGKSTFIKMMYREEKPSTGSINVNGLVIETLAERDVPYFRRQLGVIFQDFKLLPKLTVYENVAFALEVIEEEPDAIRERVTEVLGLVGLEDRADALPSELSGGEQQRVAIARAIVNNPRVLLLDEPLGALDFKLRKDLQRELKNLQRNLGITFIYVTHDQEEAMSMSDRIVVMNKGHIEQIGTPKEIYNKPKTLFVATFIGENNIVKNGEGYVAIRPENVKVRSVEEPILKEYHLGHIEDIEFVGNMEKLYVRDEKTSELLMAYQTAEEAAQWSIGDNVYVGWEQEDEVTLN
ncbi:spermidine/putrescine ABC transporter ATP-binding protein [Bacillus cereus]|nr:spermidine/putrescine ABC transporter ATP-binding protein [Bacillus cereus]